MSLFEHRRRRLLTHQAPLAARMRPRSFEEFVGQEEIIGPGKALRLSIDSDQVPSMVLWGPPGSGKTTLAQVIATVTASHFAQVSAVSAGVADLRQIVHDAQERLGQQGQRTILFIDELHRFNKAQQDAILPYVEDGTVTLIGATTENPSFEVIAPLLSRCRVFALRALTEEEVRTIVLRAMQDEERGLGHGKVELAQDALDFLVKMSNGDARVALNALELGAVAAKPDVQEHRRITMTVMEEALQHRALRYDQAGDEHYDTISAFIKSLRGSDPDAALYWLARMVEAGEDPLFIARRMVILAAEDVGMADPQALIVAVAAQQAVHFVGMPEGVIPLSEATVYLATAPKSNTTYHAYSQALGDVRTTRAEPVPLHLRNAVTGLMRDAGYGKGYQYAHSYPGHFVRQTYLPENLKGRVYYHPGDQGFERQVKERLERWWGKEKSKESLDTGQEDRT